MIIEPKIVYFEEKSLNYPLGLRLYKLFISRNIEVEILKSNRMKMEDKDPVKSYVEGKNFFVVRVRKNGEFQTCKPSAHYQLPLISGCMGMCEYCYLNTRFSEKSYITIYANIEEILSKAKEYIDKRKPQITIFEAAATSDPIPLEKYTRSLEQSILFMAEEELGRLRFVTKYSEIDSLLRLKHNGHTTIRFSINTPNIINKYEHRTSPLNARIEACKKVFESGYQTGFIIGPVFIYDDWEKEYYNLLKMVEKYLKNTNVHFEIISHRFTAKAKNQILKVFPKTTLPMLEEERKFKYGQFGYGKYVYEKKQMEEIKDFFSQNIKDIFPNSSIDYVI